MTIDAVPPLGTATVRTTTPLKAGGVVTVTAEVEANATATFSISGIATATNIAMTIDETATPPEGFDTLIGSYTVATGDNISGATVSVTVTDIFGNTTTVSAGGSVTLDTLAPMITATTVDPTSVRNGFSFTITVTTEPGATVTADVSGVDTTQANAITVAETDVAGVYAATATVSGSNEAETGKKAISVTVTDAAGNATTNASAVTILFQGKTEFTVSLHKGVNMIHVPVKDESLARASDLFNRLGGSDYVSVIVMMNDQGKFSAFTSSVAVGSRADVALTDQSAAIVVMMQARQETFTGGVLSDTVTLATGLNMVGVPRSGAVATVADLAGLSESISVVIREDAGRFLAYPPSSADVMGSQGYLVVATSEATLTLSGVPWQNTAAAAPVSSVVHDSASTPVFVVEGALVRENSLATVNGLDVRVTNLRTSEVVSDVGGRQAGSGRFAATFLDLAGGDYRIGDIFELRIDDPSGTFSGVPMVRHTVTAEDVRRSRFDFESIMLRAIPDHNALLANYPNPFNPETWIPFQLHEGGDVTITIYDAIGHVVRRLDLRYQPAGEYRSRERAAYWNGRNEHGELVSSGAYFVEMVAGDYRKIRRIVLLK